MANSLQGYFKMMTTAEIDQLSTPPPSEKLNGSSKIINDFLIHNYAPNPPQVVQFANFQQFHPQTALRHARKKSRHLAKRRVLPKKSLNSWMAFRAFYKRAFPSLQQKDASTHLTLLWKKDPFKAKWTIVAAAYSRIRDTVGKPGAPLDTYLDMVCPIIGLISAEAYFEAFNWVWDHTKTGAATLQQESEPDLRAFGHNIIHTTMTEMDIIRFCGSMGYLPLSTAIQISTSPNHGHAQQGLLASAPLLPPRSQPERGIQAFLAPSESHYDWNCQNDWTGSLSDIYNPDLINPVLEDLFQGLGSNLWNTTYVQEYQSLDDFLEIDGIGHGYLSPFVPDDLKSFNPI